MLDLSALERATQSLSNVLTETRNQAFMQSLNQTQHDAFIAGAIQNFEFTYELSWKFIRRWLEQNLGSTLCGWHQSARAVPLGSPEPINRFRRYMDAISPGT